MSRFEPYGPIPILRDGRIIKGRDWKKEFWLKADEFASHRRTPLSKAYGCYIFATRPSGGGLKPWYVGQAKKRFTIEVFSDRNHNIYNIALNSQKKGAPVMFLLARMQDSGKDFSTRRDPNKKFEDPEIDYVETLLIGWALERNSKLINIQKAKMLERLEIPGIVGDTRKIKRTESEKDLRKLFGIK